MTPVVGVWVRAPTLQSKAPDICLQVTSKASALRMFISEQDETIRRERTERNRSLNCLDRYKLQS